MWEKGCALKGNRGGLSWYVLEAALITQLKAHALREGTSGRFTAGSPLVTESEFPPSTAAMQYQECCNAC